MRLLTVALGSCLLVLTACTDPNLKDTARDESGEITEEGEVGVMRLQLGDCLVMPESVEALESLTDSAEVTSTEGVPCSMPHNGEVVLIDSTFYEDYSGDFPGEEKLMTLSAVQTCMDGVDAYTGTVWEESTFDVHLMVPGDTSWESADDRELVCIATTLDADTFEVIDTTGSMAAD